MKPENKIDTMSFKFDQFLLQLIKFAKAYHRFILFVALIYFYSNCFWGLDFTDGFFHINAASQLNNNYPFETLLTGQLLHIFYLIIGKHLIIYRLCNATLLLTSFWIISKVTNKTLDKSVINLLLATFLFIASPIINNIFGYDTLSLFMLTAIVAFILQNKIDSLKNKIVLSIMIGLFALIRIPNIAIIPFITIFLLKFYREKSWSIKKTTGVFIFLLTGALIIYFTWLILFYDSLSKGFTTFSSVDDHVFSLLLKNYLRDGIRIICYLSILIASYYWINIKKDKQLILIVLMQLVFLFAFIYNTPYVWNYSLFVSAFNYSFAVIFFIKKRKIDFTLLFILVSSFILSIGSNTGLSKTSTFGVLGLLVCLELFKQIDKKYMISWFMALTVMSLFENACWTYEDGNIFTLRKPIDIEGLKPILTSQKHYNYIHAVTEKSDSLKKEGYLIYYYGYYSHLFTFLHPAKREYYSFDQRFANTREIESIIKNNHNKNTAIFITDNIGFQKRNESSLTEKLILKNGFTTDNDNRFLIYINPSRK